MTSTMFAWKNKASTKQHSQLNIGSAANAPGSAPQPAGANAPTSVSVSSMSPNSLHPQLTTSASSPMLTVPPNNNPLTHSNSTIGLTHNNSSSNLASLATPSSSAATSASPVMTSNIAISGADNTLIYNFSAPVNMLHGMPITPNSEGPPILHKLVRYLMAKGTIENIFKATSPDLENDVQLVKKNLLKDMAMGDVEQIQLSSLTNNPHVIAEILRQYLHALPEPLFSYHMYDSFLLTHTILSQQDKIWAYRFLLAYLPQGFRGTIRAVLSLFAKIHAANGSTKMDAAALSAIFARVFLRPEEEMYYMKQDRLNTEDILRLWIEEYDQVTKPPAPPTNKITTISAFTPSHPVSQAAATGDPLNPLSPTTAASAHLTIGLNKINSQTQLTNATNPQQSPKLSLPTIPKQQNTQQTTTIIKVKPPLQASSSQNNIKPPSATSGSNSNSNNSSSSNSNNSSTSTSPAASTASPVTSSSPNPPAPNTPQLLNNINTSTPASSNSVNTTPLKPTASPSKPSTPTTTSAKPPTSAPPISSSPSPNKQAPQPTPTSVPSVANAGLTLLASLDQETIDKLNRVKGTTESLISEHVWVQLKSIAKSINFETSYKETIRYSTVLRDSKRHIMDSAEKQLSITKNDVKLFLQQFNKPLHYNLAVLSPDALANPPTGTDELKHHELKRASHLALEEITDYIFLLKTKIHTFVYKEHIIATAQIISKLKSIFDQTVSTPVSTSLSASGSLTITDNNRLSLSLTPDHSPASSPLVSKRQSVGSDKSIMRVIEVCSREITDRLKAMKKDLEGASLQEAIEIGKAVRSTKQTLHELYQENSYILPPEIKPAPASPDEGQLGTLKKTLEPLIDRIFIQIETVTKTALNPLTPEFESKQIVDKLLFINKVLSM